jgi:hypothetical protein
MTNPNDPICFNPEYIEKGVTKDGKVWEKLVPQKYGLTKREYFAAMAMQGLLGAEWFVTAEKAIHPDNDPSESYAENSVAMADALIAELNKPEGGGK